jgi:hypothetical protein
MVAAHFHLHKTIKTVQEEKKHRDEREALDGRVESALANDNIAWNEMLICFSIRRVYLRIY